MPRRMRGRMWLLGIMCSFLLALAVGPRQAQKAIPARPVEQTNAGTLSGRVILVDAGHGGTDGSGRVLVCNASNETIPMFSAVCPTGLAVTADDYLEDICLNVRLATSEDMTVFFLEEPLEAGDIGWAVCSGVARARFVSTSVGQFSSRFASVGADGQLVWNESGTIPILFSDSNPGVVYIGGAGQADNKTTGAFDIKVLGFANGTLTFQVYDSSLDASSSEGQTAGIVYAGSRQFGIPRSNFEMTHSLYTYTKVLYVEVTFVNGNYNAQLKLDNDSHSTVSSAIFELARINVFPDRYSIKRICPPGHLTVWGRWLL